MYIYLLIKKILYPLILGLLVECTAMEWIYPPKVNQSYLDLSDEVALDLRKNSGVGNATRGFHVIHCIKVSSTAQPKSTLIWLHLL